jgi:thiamine biosynthesis lipoprotein ApbE
LSLADHAVATSTDDTGDAELVALTVVAGDLAVADEVAAAGLAMGRTGIAWVAAQPGCRAFAVTADGFVQHSAGLTELLLVNGPQGSSAC